MSKPTTSELRTEQIIKAAIEVFSEKGFHQARMEDIGRAAALSKATLYLYFKDKDTLIKAIANRVFHWELEKLATVRLLPGSTAEKLQRLAEYFVVSQEETTDLMPIVYEFYALSARRTDVQQIVSEHFNIFVEALKEILQQGIEKGELSQIDIQKVATTFMALLDGAIIQKLYSDDSVSLSEQLNFGIDLLFKGLQHGTANSE